ncbi:hypothetical protein BDN71DRAFT_1426711 [Pleurotus eryngii]|uniref:Uncharacterized protein n=1 Tax=Pleurotus eryngii TaxID=5323 RepID=A0A9P6AA49_PLEER|nr:hypothetical protein BDN71DRAFT_1426711 [Pleurotus eryngii]
MTWAWQKPCDNDQGDRGGQGGWVVMTKEQVKGGQGVEGCMWGHRHREQSVWGASSSRTGSGGCVGTINVENEGLGGVVIDKQGCGGHQRRKQEVRGAWVLSLMKTGAWWASTAIMGIVDRRGGVEGPQWGVGVLT